MQEATNQSSVLLVHKSYRRPSKILWVVSPNTLHHAKFIKSNHMLNPAITIRIDKNKNLLTSQTQLQENDRHTLLKLYISRSSSVINFFLNFFARLTSLKVFPVSLCILFSTLLRILLPLIVDIYRYPPTKPNGEIE